MKKGLDYGKEAQRKARAAERDRQWRNRRLYDRLSGFSRRSWKWFLGIFLLLGIIAYPYNSLPKAAPRSALMEVLNGLACLDAAALLVLQVSETGPAVVPAGGAGAGGGFFLLCSPAENGRMKR